MSLLDIHELKNNYKVLGEYNGKAEVRKIETETIKSFYEQGVFEWILNKDNQIVHQFFKVGRVIDGIPNGK